MDGPLFEDNSQILLKIAVNLILLTFNYLVALNLYQTTNLTHCPTYLIVQLNSSLRHIIVTLNVHIYWKQYMKIEICVQKYFSPLCLVACDFL